MLTSAVVSFLVAGVVLGALMGSAFVAGMGVRW